MSGPVTTRETIGGSPSSAAAAPTAQPTVANDDPYNEVPGPGFALALAGLGGALLVRSRRVATLAVLGLALAAPFAGAQSTNTTSERTFALVDATRDAGDAVVTLQVVRGQPYRITVSLYSRDGLLLAPEQVTNLSWFNTATAYRFANVDATALEVRVQYTRDTGRDAEERFPFTLPAAPRAELEVVSADWGAPLELRLIVANFGAKNATGLTAHLEDATGTRVGAPLAQATSVLPVGTEWALSFQLDETATSLTLVLEHDENVTPQRFAVSLPASRNGSWLELVELEYHEDGTARFVVALFDGPSVVNAVAYVETAGARVGVPSVYALGLIERGERREASFALPDDLETATFVVAHEDGTFRFPVLLEPADTSGNASLELETDLPARDAAPGDTATYAVKIANEGDETLATLRVDGLPEGYTAAFTVAGSGVRSVGLPAGGTREVTVAVTVPSSATRDVGRTFDLRLVATAADGSEASVPLSLTLLGEGELELSGQNWFADGEPGGSERVTLSVKNAGSAPVRDIELAATKPTGWTVSFDPEVIDALEPGESQAVVMTVEAASDAGAGRYTLDVAASSSDLTTRPRSLVVEIAEEGASKLPWVLGAGLAGLAGVALVVKLRRK